MNQGLVRRVFAAATLGLLPVMAGPAPSQGAFIFAGVCPAVSFSISFAANLGPFSPPTGVSGIDGGGACVADDPTGLPGSLLPTIDIFGGGSSSVSNCLLILASGTAGGVSFSGGIPPTTSIQWNFAGDTNGGLLTIVGSTATGPFAAAGAFVSVNPFQTTGCLSSSAATFSFLGSLVFSDP